MNPIDYRRNKEMTEELHIPQQYIIIQKKMERTCTTLSSISIP